MSSLKLLSNYSTALNKKIHLPLWLNFFVKSLIEAVYRTLIKINFNGRKTKMKIDQKHFIKLTFSQQPFLTIIPEMTVRKKYREFKPLFKYFLILFILFAGCKNPFSPSFNSNNDSSSFAISDLKKPEGIFQNIQYAYTFKDTIIYGEMISEDFIFTYRDYEQNVDVSWGRDSEMRATYGLFQNTQQVDLIWNSILLSTVDSLTATYVRGYNLTVTFNPTDIQRYDGRVNLSLRKNINTQKWAIVKWVDESNF